MKELKYIHINPKKIMSFNSTPAAKKEFMKILESRTFLNITTQQWQFELRKTFDLILFPDNELLFSDSNIYSNRRHIYMLRIYYKSFVLSKRNLHIVQNEKDLRPLYSVFRKVLSKVESSSVISQYNKKRLYFYKNYVRL